MRRVFAIAVLIGFITSLSLPVWATACAAMASAPMCHRTMDHHHHCDSMMEERDETAAPDSVPAVRDLPGKCPMQCCLRANTANAPAIPAISFLPMLVSAENSISYAPVIFRTAGFSSHTDRGPPIA